MNAMNKEIFKNYFDLLDTVLEESIRKLVEVAFWKAARVAASAGKKAQGRHNTRAKGRAADMGRYVPQFHLKFSVSFSVNSVSTCVSGFPPLPLYQLAPH